MHERNLSWCLTAETVNAEVYTKGETPVNKSTPSYLRNINAIKNVDNRPVQAVQGPVKLKHKKCSVGTVSDCSSIFIQSPHNNLFHTIDTQTNNSPNH